MIIILHKRKILRTFILTIATGILLIWGGRPFASALLAPRDVIKKIHTSQKTVAFTFDDGPSRVFTPQVLNILKKNDIHATFFIVGSRGEQSQDILKNITDAGNEIGNHTYSHPNVKRITSSSLSLELQKADEVIFHATKKHPVLFRPPGGYVTNAIIDAAKKEGYKTVLWTWTQDTQDWRDPGEKAIIKKVLDNIQNGDIIIFHDCGGNRTQTIKALQPIINGLKEQGFSIVTVSELLKKEDDADSENVFSIDFNFKYIE